MEKCNRVYLESKILIKAKNFYNIVLIPNIRYYFVNNDTYLINNNLSINKETLKNNT